MSYDGHTKGYHFVPWYRYIISTDLRKLYHCSVKCSGARQCVLYVRVRHMTMCLACMGFIIYQTAQLKHNYYVTWNPFYHKHFTLDLSHDQFRTCDIESTHKSGAKSQIFILQDKGETFRIHNNSWKHLFQFKQRIEIF